MAANGTGKPLASEPGVGVAADWRARSDYRAFRSVPTRWLDNDAYGHVNNAVYYAYFDTAVNGWLMEATGTDVRQLPAIGVVVETGCRYFSELSFPDTIAVGLRIEKLGTSSLVYRLGLFRGDAPTACAVGRFVHVYVDALTRRPVPIPEAIRAVACQLV